MLTCGLFTAIAMRLPTSDIVRSPHVHTTHRVVRLTAQWTCRPDAVLTSSPYAQTHGHHRSLSNRQSDYLRSLCGCSPHLAKAHRASALTARPLRALTEPTGCPQGIPSGGSAFAVAHLDRLPQKPSLASRRMAIAPRSFSIAAAIDFAPLAGAHRAYGMPTGHPFWRLGLCGCSPRLCEAHCASHLTARLVKKRH
jgi:hypothetical protein